jgi:hypothetical protein
LLLRYLVIALLVYIVIRVVKAFLAGAKSGKGDRSVPPEGEEMVLDPQCQTYVPKGEAYSRAGQYFCSRECARLYLDRQR